MSKKIRNLILQFSLSLVFLFPLASHSQCVSDNNNIVINSDFENGIAPWKPLGNSVNLTASTEQKHSGLASSFVSGRNATWQGPIYNLLNKLSSGQKYCINAWVKWESGASGKIDIVVQKISPSGVTYEIISKEFVASDTWTQLSGIYDYNSSGDETSLKIYVEEPYQPGSSSRHSFYLDDFLITDDRALDQSANNIISETGLNGAIYYVSPFGSDVTNNGTSQATPFKTLQKASNLTEPGDIVYAMDGTYQVQGNKDILHISRSGTASNWIMYAALPGHNPKLKLSKFDAIGVWGADYIVIQGFEIEGNNKEVTLEYALDQKANDTNRITTSTGISVHRNYWGTDPNNYAHHIIVRNNHVYDCSGGGIGANSADYVLIENNKVHHNAYYSPWAMSGISLFKNFNFDNSTKYKMIIRNNISYANRNFVPFVHFPPPTRITDGHGIIVDTNKDSIKMVNGNKTTALYTGRTLIANNLTYLNGGRGFNLYKSNHIDVVNNVTYRDGDTLTFPSEIMIGDSDDINVYNNIFYTRDNVVRPFFNWWLGNKVNIDYNLVYNANEPIAPALNNIFGEDPLFINTTGPLENYDFQLQTNSPALDSGSNQFTTNLDLNGDMRPGNGVVDIGAYESSGM